jgi:hypothetical protein
MVPADILWDLKQFVVRKWLRRHLTRLVSRFPRGATGSDISDTVHFVFGEDSLEIWSGGEREGAA